MKELIYREFYLSRKNILITCGIAFGIYTIGVVCALSARFGNIARYVSDEMTIHDALVTTYYFAILSGILLATIVECVPILLASDFKSGWTNYILSTGVSVKKIVGVKYLVFVIILVASMGLSAIIFGLTRLVTGVDAEPILPDEISFGIYEPVIFVVFMSVFLLIMVSYRLMSEFIFRDNKSVKAQVIQNAPTVVGVLLIFALFFYGTCRYDMADKDEIARLSETMSKIREHSIEVIIGAILLGLIISGVFYFISVWAVRKEMKCERKSV